MHGAAGPSDVDASAWQHLYSSFGDYASVSLCNAVAHYLSTIEADPAVATCSLCGLQIDSLRQKSWYTSNWYTS